MSSLTLARRAEPGKPDRLDPRRPRRDAPATVAGMNTVADKVHRFLLTNDEAIDAGRKLGRLIVSGYELDDPRVTQCADRLRQLIAEALR